MSSKNSAVDRCARDAGEEKACLCMRSYQFFKPVNVRFMQLTTVLPFHCLGHSPVRNGLVVSQTARIRAASRPAPAPKRRVAYRAPGPTARPVPATRARLVRTARPGKCPSSRSRKRPGRPWLVRRPETRGCPPPGSGWASSSSSTAAGSSAGLSLSASSPPYGVARTGCTAPLAGRETPRA